MKLKSKNEIAPTLGARMANRLKEIPTTTLVLIFFFAGFLVAMLGVWIVENVSGINLLITRDIITICFGFFWGCVGAVWIMRKERPDIVTLRGKPAVVLGVVVVVIFWGLGLLGLYDLLGYILHF